VRGRAKKNESTMQTDDLGTRPVSLKLFVCTKTHCTERVVCVKIRTADATAQQLSGPALLRALAELMAEKGVAGKVWETSCMGGCPIGPRLNVVGAGGFKATMRYLHFRGVPRKTLCAPWEDVGSLEALLDRYVHEEAGALERASCS
jgi:hypothetical protein